MGSRNSEEETKRYKAPYNEHRHIPTIRHFRQEKEDRQEFADKHALPDEGKDHQRKDAASRYLSQDSREGSEDDEEDQVIKDQDPDRPGSAKSGNSTTTENGVPITEDTSEARVDARDAKSRRKAMKGRKGKRAEREVTDPVTHLPVRIHDLQASDLKRVPENVVPPGLASRTATGTDNKSKSDSALEEDSAEISRSHRELQNLFPPPEYDAIREELASVQTLGLTVGLASLVAVGVAFVVFERYAVPKAEKSAWPHVASASVLLVGLASVAFVIVGVRRWISTRVQTIWEEELWHAQRHEKRSDPQAEETTHWLNHLISSVWPLVNPDLFISLADTLEDVMQASLPSVVRMVSIEDIGQGSESIRILGVRWLPTGAAARSVGADGKLAARDDSKPNDRSVPDQGEVDDRAGAGEQQGDDKGGQQSDSQLQEIAEGMEAEEGDFVNIEVAFSYRTRSTAKKFQDRAKHAHLYLAFYLPGRIKLPVYVDLRGLVGVARMRLQLTPDPPFFSLMTFTFLGQPKVDVACIPLARKGLNIMDLPIISHFVQSAVDAAVAEYVAPKSMTLDLKDMLAGEDFKKDTHARGVIVCKIKRAFDFKQGDASIPLVRDGSADPYITVGWAKFVKPLWSTRVIVKEMEPHWEETAYLLVTSDELNVDERLRVQLWDSDRMTADDDLGRVEMDLKGLMRDPKTRGKMQDRVDGFKALKAGDSMPGKLEWSVGYFAKTHVQSIQFEKQTATTDIRSKEQLDNLVTEITERKLRESKKDETQEAEQLRLQQYKEIEDRMIASAPPLDDYPSGMLAIQIHEATGLENRALHNADRKNHSDEASDEVEQSEDLPSSYCNIILNHQKIYRTRVKPKNAKPFFNAGTERFIRDWRTTEVYITVRDSRIHEDDPLMGLVRLPLIEIFKNRAQVNNTYPISGGVGYGRVRISMIFRSIDAQLPRNLLGWDFGTLIVAPEIRGKNLSSDVSDLRMKLQTSVSTGHMHANERSHWKSRHNKGLHLGVRKRYSSPLIIQFRKDSHFLDKTTAFCVLWLQDLVDDEDTTLTLPVWKGDLKRATTCRLESCGEKLGEIEINLRFCRGLSRYHHRLAKNDKHMADILEVVETSRYQTAKDDEEKKAAAEGRHSQGVPGKHRAIDDNPNADGDSSEDSSSSDDDSDGEGAGDANNGDSKNGSNSYLQAEGDRNLMDSAKDYRAQAKQLHRRHRGIMQYKGARTMWWMKHKVDHLQDRISGVFEHSERTGHIESEA